MTGRRRRRGGAEGIVIISWRDIPAQVTGDANGEKVTHLMHARFQHAIDRAAMVSDLTDTNSYVQEWKRTVLPLEGLSPEGDAAAAVAAEGERLEADFDRDKLEAFVSNGGLDPAEHPDAYAGKERPPESEAPDA